MSNEREGSGEDNRAIAEKVRQLARQTQIAQIQQELFDLADRLERMGEGDGSTSSGKIVDHPLQPRRAERFRLYGSRTSASCAGPSRVGRWIVIPDSVHPSAIS